MLKAIPNNGCGFDVVDSDKRLIAIIVEAWGKYKIVGEDVYAKTVDELVERLEKRP